MMKLRIDKKFIDKYTGCEYCEGDILSFNSARGKELLADPRELVSIADEVRIKKKSVKSKKV